ncbi:hypothetical protein PVAP13_5NG382200 [Panicum virgatum]|uniref:CCHC-type domain-containing protein n=1 Tax=Panicum virgatum TaxID=38727 RepID=A0A8T0RZW0_PANVG|nr:hypothetical protein PVAP13_5NG382200 [Panicum virgatum]
MDVPSPPPLHLSSPSPRLTPSSATTINPPPFTPNPAATISPSLSTPKPAVSGTSLSASPAGAQHGRTRAQRWSQETPPEGKSTGVPTPSFRDVLLAEIAARAREVVVEAPVPPSPTHHSPRIVVFPAPRQSPVRPLGPDADGWQPAVSRRSRQVARRLARRPHRPVPADLRGKCFNCFSPRHRAVACNSSTRCFLCRALGHRSYGCPEQCAGHVVVPPRMMWRPVPAPVLAAPPTPQASGEAQNVPPAVSTGDSIGRWHKHARKRRRNHHGSAAPAPEDSGEPPSSTSPSADQQLEATAQPHRPRRLIARSATISRREELLTGRALVVLVITDNPEELAAVIVPEIAHRFEIEEASLAIYPMGLASFLLISPDEATASRIFNAGRPFILPPGRLHLMRWSRFSGSTAGVLPVTAQIELRGIPAHAWELDTAAQLLNEWCLPYGVLPETEG